MTKSSVTGAATGQKATGHVVRWGWIVWGVFGVVLATASAFAFSMCGVCQHWGVESWSGLPLLLAAAAAVFGPALAVFGKMYLDHLAERHAKPNRAVARAWLLGHTLCWGMSLAPLMAAFLFFGPRNEPLFGMGLLLLSAIAMLVSVPVWTAPRSQSMRAS